MHLSCQNNPEMGIDSVFEYSMPRCKKRFSWQSWTDGVQQFLSIYGNCTLVSRDIHAINTGSNLAGTPDSLACKIHLSPFILIIQLKKLLLGWNLFFPVWQFAPRSTVSAVNVCFHEISVYGILLPTLSRIYISALSIISPHDRNEHTRIQRLRCVLGQTKSCPSEPIYWDCRAGAQRMPGQQLQRTGTRQIPKSFSRSIRLSVVPIKH